MLRLPIETVVMQSTCKIIHYHFWWHNEILVQKGECFIPALSMWNNENSIANSMFAKPCQYVPCTSTSMGTTYKCIMTVPIGVTIDLIKLAHWPIPYSIGTYTNTSLNAFICPTAGHSIHNHVCRSAWATTTTFATTHSKLINKTSIFRKYSRSVLNPMNAIQPLSK